MSPDYDQEERDNYTARARSSAPRDGVFWVHYYNRVRAFGPNAIRLEPHAVLPGLSEEEVQEYTEQAHALFAQEGPLGAAYFSYPGARPYDEEFDLFKNNNPGFSDYVYGAVAHQGIIAMR